MKFTTQEKEKIFVGRTQAFWPHFWNRYEELVGHETWSAERLAEYNFAQRVDMLAYAYGNSPFYRRIYDEAGLQPGDVKTEADWLKVPVVTKAMLRACGEEIVVDARRGDMMMGNTGGSTGEPLQVFRDKASVTWDFQGRSMGWWTGRAPGAVFMPDRGVLGQDEVYLSLNITKGYEKSEPGRYPKAVIVLSTVAVTDEDRMEFVREVQRLEDGAYHLHGYTGALTSFVQFCVDRGVRLPRPMSMHCGASVLTESARVQIEEFFGAPLMNNYGSCEMGPVVATEHRLNGKDHHMYVLSDLFHLELLGDDGMPVPCGARGETVITAFNNRVAPLIRYDQGDRTAFVAGADPLGMPFPRIESIQGRTTDFLYAKTGGGRDVIDSASLSVMFDAYPHCVKAFQFRQSEPGKARVLVVPNREYPRFREDLAKAYEEFAGMMNGCIDLAVEEVESISYERGKLRLVVHE